MGEDDRQLITDSARRLGLKDSEVDQALKCTGVIHCKDTPDGILSAGALCAIGLRDSKGTCKADRVATAGHFFVDSKALRFKKGLNNCQFYSYSGSVSKILVKDLSNLDPSRKSHNPHIDMRSDKVVVRLKNPLRDCDPYDQASDKEQIEIWHEILALTSLQKGMDPQNLMEISPWPILVELTK